MIDIIVFSKNEKIRNDLVQAFTSKNFWIKQVENNKQLKNLDISLFDLIVANIEEQSEWLDFLFNELDDIPLVVLCQSPINFFYNEKYPKNLIDIISIPVPEQELFSRFNNIIRGLDYYQAKHAIPGSSGKLADFSFLEIIQNFMRRKYTGILKIKMKTIKAEINFYKGNIDSAFCQPEYKGLNALEIITFFDSGDFEFMLEEFSPKLEIKYDMQKILFNLIEKYSQFETLFPYLPEINEVIVKNPEASSHNLPEHFKNFLDDFEENLTLSELFIKTEYEDKVDLLVVIKELWQNNNLIPQKESAEKENKKSSGFFKSLFGKQEQEELYEEIYEEEDEEQPVKKLNLQLNLDDIHKIREQIKK